jgi:hypothetical protein
VEQWCAGIVPFVERIDLTPTSVGLEIVLDHASQLTGLAAGALVLIEDESGAHAGFGSWYGRFQGQRKLMSRTMEDDGRR